MSTEITELDLLKERADRMGISYHPSIGVEKLKEKLAIKLDKSVDTEKKESIAQRNARLRKDANKLVRIRLTCMNQAKKAWPGEVISVSNSAIGCIKKFIPFEAEDGYHIPQVLLGILKDRQYQSFYLTKVNGIKVKRSKLVREFAIEILPSLTSGELKDLVIKQALNNSIEQ